MNWKNLQKILVLFHPTRSIPMILMRILYFHTHRLQLPVPLKKVMKNTIYAVVKIQVNITFINRRSLQTQIEKNTLILIQIFAIIRMLAQNCTYLIFSDTRTVFSRYSRHDVQFRSIAEDYFPV